MKLQFFAYLMNYVKLYGETLLKRQRIFLHLVTYCCDNVDLQYVQVHFNEKRDFRKILMSQFTLLYKQTKNYDIEYKRNLFESYIFLKYCQYCHHFSYTL